MRQAAATALLGVFLTLAGTPAAAQDRLPLVGGSGGTNDFWRGCGPGFVLTGISARVGLTVDAIGARCRPIRADGTLGAEVDKGTWGGSGGTLISRSCTGGSVIAQQVAKHNGIILTDLAYHCFRWIAATRRWDVNDRGVVLHVIPSGASGMGSGTSSTCPSYQRPGDAIRGRSGTIIDAVGLVCNDP